MLFQPIIRFQLDLHGFQFDVQHKYITQLNSDLHFNHFFFFWWWWWWCQQVIGVCFHFSFSFSVCLSVCSSVFLSLVNKKKFAIQTCTHSTPFMCLCISADNPKLWHHELMGKYYIIICTSINLSSNKQANKIKWTMMENKCCGETKWSDVNFFYSPFTLNDCTSVRV